MKTFFYAVFIGICYFFKYAFLAVAFIITAACMICAGKHYGGLK